ncbi:MAG: terpene cyclase/mutase family protein [Gemmataceae bacterium]|nr:terpene cyclase/mutase family protein [Gemmataceae bacterium]MCI0739392.1 terpene cyclase/mutase family protein [Gemmataceae bacterium]
MRSLFVILGLLVSLGLHAVQADEIPAEFKPSIEKSLAWLVQQQNKDGSWPDVWKQTDVACTGAAGLALLMEGSTAAKGKYSQNIKSAVDWMVQNCRKGKDDGLLHARLVRTDNMIGQSYAVLFLAGAYTREEKSDVKDFNARLTRVRRREMEEVLKRAVQFIVRAQAANGGWSPTFRQDGKDLDDAVSTLQQILALRAAQQAGIDVPKETIEKAFGYLEKMTTPRGGMPFSSLKAGKDGNERPGLTIAAFASTYGSDQIKADLLKKWLKYCEYTTGIDLPGIQTQDRFHLAVAAHGLGDDGWAKLVDKRQPMLVWSRDRGKLLNRFKSVGGTTHKGWNPNPVFGTAMNLIALQLDNDYLPVFRMKRNW